MFVHTYIYVCVCTALCMYLYMCTQELYTCTHVCKYGDSYTHMCTHAFKGTHVHHQDQHKPLHALASHLKINKNIIQTVEAWQEQGRARRCGTEVAALVVENKKMLKIQNGLNMMIDYKVSGRGHFLEHVQHSHDTNKLCMYMEKVRRFHLTVHL